MEEKKGEILNQLAIITDLLEKVNLKEAITTDVVFLLKEREFNEIYKKISKKANIKLEGLEDTFSMIIGSIKFIFNKSNV